MFLFWNFIHPHVTSSRTLNCGQHCVSEILNTWSLLRVKTRFHTHMKIIVKLTVCIFQPLENEEPTRLLRTLPHCTDHYAIFQSPSPYFYDVCFKNIDTLFTPSFRNFLTCHRVTTPLRNFTYRISNSTCCLFFLRSLVTILCRWLIESRN